ncbi:PREDICTED: 60S ribosomal protein L10-like [Cercocebus atys]|uniref:60S ribosomal protein L10-like n=1 Tax=Cercocebus atys TaxID=9531 RepID=UPI0005F3A6C1|nr:PREDICTED: 60S ribosomal protein L10-like [Cercocebus atys]
MQPVSCMGCSKGPWRQAFQMDVHVSDLALLSVQAPNRYSRCLWKAPGCRGQVIMPIRTKLQNKEHATEALCRAKFKFPGHQNIHFSKKWDFTKFNVDEFEDMMAEKQLISDSCGVKYTPNPDPLDKRWALHS